MGILEQVGIFMMANIAMVLIAAIVGYVVLTTISALWLASIRRNSFYDDEF